MPIQQAQLASAGTESMPLPRMNSVAMAARIKLIAEIRFISSPCLVSVCIVQSGVRAVNRKFDGS